MPRGGLLALVLLAAPIGCGGKTHDQSTLDDAGPDTTIADVGPRRDTDAPRVDAETGPSCTGLIDPLNPPVGCGPAEIKAVPCSTTAKVATCPSTNACMSPVAPPSGFVADFRIGRVRMWAPDALLSLAAIWIDPNVNAHCVNMGTELTNWLVRIDRKARVLTLGNAVPSADGRTFEFESTVVDGATHAEICPGFPPLPKPVMIEPSSSVFTDDGGLLATGLFSVQLAMGAGKTRALLPLRDVQVKGLRLSAEGDCIGKWEREFWCDGDTLGWTTGAALVAKISVEEADFVPVKEAGCQSLCAILANDASKIEGKRCKRGSDGKIPEIGNACVGSTGCKNAWSWSSTFGAYAVKIIP